MDGSQVEASGQSISPQFEISAEGIPLVAKEGRKAESKQFKQLVQLVDKEQAMQVYGSIKQLESGEFKDSKLRDENGELMIVWHGSPRKFDHFRSDAKGEWRWKNAGIHFSSSRELVKQYSDKAQRALDLVCGELLESLEKVTPETEWNAERFRKVAGIYNEIIRDLIENGENSKYYDKAYKYDPVEKKLTRERKPDMDAIKYIKGRPWATEWFLELFGGEMPTKENTFLDKDNVSFGENIPIYQGNGIGSYKYAAVLNIENPFRQETDHMDWGFSDGEKSHEQNGTDGTILFHSNGVIGMGQLRVEKAKGTYSAGVFDMSKIKVIGRQDSSGFTISKDIKTPNLT